MRNFMKLKKVFWDEISDSRKVAFCGINFSIFRYQKTSLPSSIQDPFQRVRQRNNFRKFNLSRLPTLESSIFTANSLSSYHKQSVSRSSDDLFIISNTRGYGARREERKHVHLFAIKTHKSEIGDDFVRKINAFRRIQMDSSRLMTPWLTVWKNTLRSSESCNGTRGIRLTDFCSTHFPSLSQRPTNANDFICLTIAHKNIPKRVTEELCDNLWVSAITVDLMRQFKWRSRAGAWRGKREAVLKGATVSNLLTRQYQHQHYSSGSRVWRSSQTTASADAAILGNF